MERDLLLMTVEIPEVKQNVNKFGKTHFITAVACSLSLPVDFQL
jgi:hypothetical protein